MSLIISLRSEILKTKRTAAFYFTLIGAGIVPFLFLFSTIAHGFPNENKSAQDPLNFMFKLSAEMTGICILPMFVILICTLLPQVEYKNNAWKQVLTSPQKKENVFTGKFLNIHLMILLFLVASHLFMWVAAIAAHFIQPQINILNHPLDFNKVLADNAHAYLSVLAICALQFWIGLRSKNFIAPIAIGIVCWLTGTLMVFEYQSSLSIYFPHSFHAIRFSPVFKPQLSQVEWTSLGYSVLFLVLGFLDFNRRRMI
ncbi:MAG: ABC transporter permease [Chitinophagaceae bacterium]